MIDIRVGDCREVLATLPPRSVQCCVTSPPYFGLRNYGVDGQMGLESTLSEYITGMVDVFRLVRDVLADDGTVFLNVGDSYASSGISGKQSPTSRLGVPADGGPVRMAGGIPGANPKMQDQVFGRAPTPAGMKPKDLMMVPARLAIALQDDGWYLRSDIIWHKPNPMPESVTDRPTSSHEHIFLLTKSARYYYDADAIREELQTPEHMRGKDGWGTATKDHHDTSQSTIRNGNGRMGENPNGRNCRNVWSIATAPFSGAHFAVFPPEIPRRCILAGTSERGQCPACAKPWVRVMSERPYPAELANAKKAHGGIGNNLGGQRHQDWLAENPKRTTGWQASCECDAGDPIPQTILDPFAGAGTTLLVADRLGRNGVGIELNAEYAQLAKDRIYNDAPMFAGVKR